MVLQLGLPLVKGCADCRGHGRGPTHPHGALPAPQRFLCSASLFNLDPHGTCNCFGLAQPFRMRHCRGRHCARHGAHVARMPGLANGPGCCWGLLLLLGHLTPQTTKVAWGRSASAQLHAGLLYRNARPVVHDVAEFAPPLCRPLLALVRLCGLCRFKFLVGPVVFGKVRPARPHVNAVVFNSLTPFGLRLLLELIRPTARPVATAGGCHVVTLTVVVCPRCAP